MSTLSLHLISLYLKKKKPNVGGVFLLCGGIELNLACKLKATNKNDKKKLIF
jgi:hypothetical protein